MSEDSGGAPIGDGRLCISAHVREQRMRTCVSGITNAWWWLLRILVWIGTIILSLRKINSY
jgi:hypothetical protein